MGPVSWQFAPRVARSCGPPLTSSEAHCRLSKFAYLTYAARSSCWCCWPAVTLPRTWRSWCSVLSWPCCAARPHDLGSNLPTALCSPPSAAPAPSLLVVLRRQAGDAAALAPAAGRRRLDLPAPRNRATATRPGAAADRPPLGLPAQQGRTPAPGHQGLGHRDPHHATSSWTGPDAATDDHDLAGVPAPAGGRHPRLRLLHGRHHLAAAAGCAVLHRTGHPPGGRRDHQPRRWLGRPAGAQPVPGDSRGRRTATALCAPRPRPQVLSWVRRAEASNSAPKKTPSRPLTSASFTSAGSWLKARCHRRALSSGGSNSGGEGVTPGRGASETTRRSSRSE
jgi:hypothetical protein